MENQEILNPTTVSEALNGSHREKWIKTMEDEYNCLINNNT